MRVLLGAALVSVLLVGAGPMSAADGPVVYLETGLETDSPSDWGSSGRCVEAVTDGQPGTFWQIVDAVEWPHVQIGPRTGTHYLHAGLSAPETGYWAGCEKQVSSPSLNVTGAVNPVLEFWLAGSAEPNDELVVSLHDTSPTRDLYLGTITGADLWEMEHFESYLGAEYRKYSFNFKHLVDDEDLDGWIAVEWTFKTSALFEQGPGWNIDDIIVKEA